MPDQLIGFVGMDGPMAGRLLDAGYATKPPGARGADLAKSPAEVVRTSDIEISRKSKRRKH